MIDSIDPTEKESEKVIASLRSQLDGLLPTVSSGKQSVNAFHKVIQELRQKNLSVDINRATSKLLRSIAGLVEIYEALESFGLKLQFRIDERFGPRAKT